MRKWLHNKFDWFDCRFVEKVKGKKQCRDCGLWEIRTGHSVMFGSGDFEMELDTLDDK